MKSHVTNAQRTFTQLLCVGVVLGVLGAAVGRWTTVVALSSALDLYRIVSGICAHGLSFSDEHLLGLAAIGITVLLCTGIGRGAFFSARLWWRTRQRLRRLLVRRLDRPPAGLAHAGAAIGFHDMVDVVDDARPLALCYGLRRPRVCISTGLITLLLPTELDAVLLHEHHHRLRYEPLRMLIAETVATTLFFAPLLQELLSRYLMLKEIEADHAAVTAQGTLGPLAGALYKLLNQASVDSRWTALLVGGISPTGQRIDHLLAPDMSQLAPLSRLRLCISLVSGVAFLVLLPLLASPHLLLSLASCRVSAG